MVDLTNAKVGDWCVFRDGGIAPINHIAGHTAAFASRRDAVWTSNGRVGGGYESPGDVVVLHKHPPMWPDDRGWYRFANMVAKEFGGVTLVCNGHGSYYYGCDKCPEWLSGISDHDSIEANIDAVEAAYAAHLAEQAKPALVWQDLPFMSAAKHESVIYVAHEAIGINGLCYVAYRAVNESLSEIISGVDLADAKAACEQHARQSAK